MELPDLDPVIHQPTRLRIMGLLYRNRRVGHVALRDALGLTDGNVATHVRRLDAEGYVRSARVLTGTSFSLVYDLTPRGADAFRAYLHALALTVERLR